MDVSVAVLFEGEGLRICPVSLINEFFERTGLERSALGSAEV
jgi:hypothetical protein